MFEKIFDLIKNNFKNPKLYVFLLVVLLTVLVLFPYIDANFFYYNRVNDRIDILTKVSEINVEQIQENEISLRAIARGFESLPLRQNGKRRECVSSAFTPSPASAARG